MKKQLGIVGMGVMGRSLARNWAKSGHSLSLYNRRVSGSEEGVAQALTQQFVELRQATAYEELSDFVASLEQPRMIVLMVTAGPAVDELIAELRPLLQSGDLIIDAGNAHYLDTERRMSMLKTYELNMLGLGVSGGEQGALEGASLMAGGTPSAYALAEPFLSGIAAKTPAGRLALKHIGPGGSGHFVKMVHNAIEYAEMQAIAEAFEFMHSLMGLDYQTIAEVFEAWNDSSQQSYLLEISSRIVRTKDDEGYVLDRIADRAAYNQTGAATLVEGALKGEPLSMVASALFARFISSKKAQRQELSQYAERSAVKPSVSADELKQAYAFTRIINHYQHFEMIASFSERLGWKVNLSDLCSVWSSGCIIRSTLLQQLMPKVDGQLSALFDKATRDSLLAQKQPMKKVVSAAIQSDVPLSTMQTALNYYQQITQEQSSAALVQAQRDYFGAHGVYFKQSAETLTFIRGLSDRDEFIGGAFLGLALLLLLILRFRLPAFLSLLISTIAIGLLLGLKTEAIFQIIEKGMGGTLGYVATIVGLGAIFGALLEITGSAEALSRFLLERFGLKNASWTMLFSGFIIAIPVFFDVAFILLVPLLYSLQQRTKKSLLYFALPLLAGLAVTHAFIPPTPGPIAVASILGADLGMVILVGFFVGMPAAIVSGIFYGRYISSKIFIAVEGQISEEQRVNYPSIIKILAIVFLPIVLIVLAALAKLEVWPMAEGLKRVIAFIGHPFAALILANILAWIFLGLGENYSKHNLLKVATKSMEPAGTIILLTGAGGVLKQLLIDSSIGLEIAESFARADLSIFVVAFSVAALVRVLQGSSTVAMITAASIVAPLAIDAGYSSFALALITVAIASGASIFSHVNDSGFWLVSQYLKLNERQTYRSWTMMTTILGFTGLAVVLLLSLLVV